MIFNYYGLRQYLSLSLNSIIYNFTYYTFISSLFIDQINPYDPFFFFSLILTFFMLFFTYLIARIIEMANGTRFLFKLFLFCGFFSILFYFLLRLVLITYYPITDFSFLDSVGLAWGGIFGLMTYSIFPAMNQKLTGIITFIPLRMKARTFLIIIIMFRLIPGLIYGLYYTPLYFLLYFPELGGILGSYFVFKYRIFKR